METRNIKLARVRTELAAFGWKILYDWSFSLAVIIAYNLLISLLPLILCLFAISSLILGDDGTLQKTISDRLVKAFPGQGLSDTLEAIFNSLSNQAGLVFGITFVVSIFTGSRLFICIDDVLTIIYRIRERTILDQNFQAIKMVLLFIIFMPLIIISSSIPAVLMKTEALYSFITTVLSGLLVFVLFCLVFYFVPKRKMAWKRVWCGALFTAAGLEILLFLFPIYVHQFMTNYIGQIGLIIMALLLFYVLGIIFILGAQINAYFFDHIKALPAGVGNCLSEFADREQTPLISENIPLESGTSALVEGFNPEH